LGAASNCFVGLRALVGAEWRCDAQARHLVSKLRGRRVQDTARGDSDLAMVHGSPSLPAGVSQIPCHPGFRNSRNFHSSE
jgi:microcystin-dependent protein